MQIYNADLSRISDYATGLHRCCQNEMLGQGSWLAYDHFYCDQPHEKVVLPKAVL